MKFSILYYLFNGSEPFLPCLGCAMTAFAGEWQQPGEGTWKWKNDDSTYAANGWYWLDGNQDGIAECYYFNESGTLLTNTTTPDLYTVNGDGQWTVNGVVQTQASTQAQAPLRQPFWMPKAWPVPITGQKKKCSAV